MTANTFSAVENPGQSVVVHLAGEADLSAREQLDAAFAPLIGVPVAIVHVADLTSADTTLLNAVEKVVQARTERFGIDAPLVSSEPSRLSSVFFSFREPTHTYASIRRSMMRVSNGCP